MILLILMSVVFVIGISALLAFRYLEREVAKSPSIVDNPLPLKPSSTVVPLEKLHSAAWRGTLEVVDLGETRAVNRMSIVVSGKEIRIQNDRVEEGIPMGKFVGVASIEELKSYIGKPVEVYAKEIDATHYTWYGDSDYYIRVLQ